MDLRSVEEKRAEKWKKDKREALLHVENLRTLHGLNEQLPLWVAEDPEVYEVVVSIYVCTIWMFSFSTRLSKCSAPSGFVVSAPMY